MASDELKQQARTVAEARGLYERTKASPQSGLDEATIWLTSADPNRVVAGRWARAVALFELGKNDEALDEFRRAMNEGPDLLNDWIAISMAAAESAGGMSDDATVRLEGLLHVDDELIVAYSASQLGMIRLHQGQVVESLELIDKAITMFRQWPLEEAGLARVLNNVGYCSLILGRIRDAETHLIEGMEHAKARSQDLLLAGMEQNLAYAQMCLGNVPGALDGYRRSLDRYRSLGETSRNLVTLYDDMAEAYRLAGLGRDALRYARLSLWVARQGTNVEKLADAEFRRARCLVDLGHWEAAIGSARAAAMRYTESGRNLWSERSDLLALEARTRVGPPTDGSVDDLVRRVPTIAANLESAGWTQEALAARNMAAQAYLQQGLREEASTILEGSPQRLAAGTNPDTDPIPASLRRPEQLMEHLELLYGDALMAQARGRPPRPLLQEVRTILAGHQARLADPELRAGVTKLALRFRDLALDEVIDSASFPIRILEVEEQWRGASRPARPTYTPQGGVQAELMSQLRVLCRQRLDQAGRDEKLEEAIAELESQIRERSLSTVAVEPLVMDRVDLEPIRQWVADNDGVFVEWFEHRGRLFAVALDPRDGNDGLLRVCGDAAEIRAQADRIGYTMARLLRSSEGSATSAVAWEATRDDCRRLGLELFPAALENDRPLVVSPTAGLNALPWSLVAAHDSSVSLVPGAASWSAVGVEIDTTNGGLLIGPGLSAAHKENVAFGKVVGHPRTAVGPDATAQNLLALLQTSSILHVAAHSSFRGESIMMSFIDMSDGPVSVYELGGVGRTPALVILAACEAGRTSDETSEWLGIAPELLRSGTECLIAPFHPIADDDAAVVMSKLYANMEDRSMADALAFAQRDLSDASPRLQASSHAFLAIGRGSVRLARASP